MQLLKVIIFSLVLLKAGDCGDFIKQDGRVYYISYPQAKDWHQAYRYCSSLGMYLLDIRTEMEKARVCKILDQYHTTQNLSSATPFWTSGTDLGSEGNYYWLTTGQQVMYTDWFGTNPDNWFNPEFNR